MSSQGTPLPAIRDYIARDNLLTLAFCMVLKRIHKVKHTFTQEDATAPLKLFEDKFEQFIKDDHDSGYYHMLFVMQHFLKKASDTIKDMSILDAAKLTAIVEQTVAYNSKRTKGHFVKRFAPKDTADKQ